MVLFPLVLLSSVVVHVVWAVPSSAATQCTGTIASLGDVSAAIKCTTIDIMSFTVPAGETFNLALEDGTTVNMTHTFNMTRVSVTVGDIAFGNKTWDGPLFQISGDNIVFNGNGHTFDGGGPFYWDGEGANGGVTKPSPMMKRIWRIKISGIFTNVNVVNSPEGVYSVSNPGLLTMSNLIIDDSDGNTPNSKSDGLPSGQSTVGFAVSTTKLIIENSTIINQDDCIAVDKGNNITLRSNTCMGGNGISIGPVSSGATVSDVVIQNNNIIQSDQAIRITTDAAATDGSVTNVTYSGNTGSQLRMFGVLIDQSAPSILGVPGNGVEISGITFMGSENTLFVNESADNIAVNCGAGSCVGIWDWSALTINGGSYGPINFCGIDGIWD
ncbi:glycoside hydrolase family 28 protein [Gelatoporia subvermispora B]|uniref:endo-polygalacturonase n=1 Tax=Ceriporiopsis subvermispora (strain B) TaxID=914234 RepID=M2R5M0_CERS8|nr:glycoside hydrolase family 28 protein [Gelatoporia subvermispora B]